jgi:hypothetical protein
VSEYFLLFYRNLSHPVRVRAAHPSRQLVLVDPEDADLMEHGQLGNGDRNQGHEVDHKVERIILSVEAGQEEPEFQEGKEKDN